MMIKKSQLVSYLLTLIVYSQISVAATTLFDPLRGTSPPSSTPPTKPRAIKKHAPAMQYKLVGISSLSLIYNVTFQNTKNKKFKKIKWQKDNAAGDSPLSDFHITQVDNRRVILQANSKNQYKCKENETNRISCAIDKNEMIFNLVTNKPTQPARNLLSKSIANNKNKKSHKKTPSKNPFKLR